MSIFAVPSLILAVLSLITFVAQAFALVDCTRHRADAFPAIDRGSKTGWLIGLTLAVVAHMLFWDPINLFNLIGIVVALVYLLDVRPSLKAITSR